jgi:hypothetical protein
LELKIKDGVMEDMLREVIGIIEVAEYIGCMHTVHLALDVQLQSLGQVLWDAIPFNPTGWLDFGARIHSFNITKEAMVHIIGVWHSYDEEKRQSINSKLLPIIERKAAELDKLKMRTQEALITYTPENLKRDIREAGHKHIQLARYGVEIVDWMIADFWRQCMGLGITRLAMGIHGKDAGFKLINGIYVKNAGAIMNLNDTDEYFKCHPLTARGATRFKERIVEWRVELSKIVKPLMTSSLILDLTKTSHGVRHYVCAKITKDDLAEVIDSAGENLDWVVIDGKKRKRKKAGGQNDRDKYGGSKRGREVSTPCIESSAKKMKKSGKVVENATGKGKNKPVGK